MMESDYAGTWAVSSTGADSADAPAQRGPDHMGKARGSVVEPSGTNSGHEGLGKPTAAAVVPEDFTPADWWWLNRAVEIIPDGPSVAEVLEALERGILCYVRLPRGCLLLELHDYHGRKELFIFSLVGEGVLRGIGYLAEELRALAFKAGCRKITGVVYRSGLERVYRRLGAKPAGQLMSLEV